MMHRYHLEKKTASIEETTYRLVSVVIPTYNQAGYLRQAIESILGQTYSNIELIVVDDGSTDETSELLSQYRGRLVAIRSPNSGTACARNVGVREAKGEFVAFLDHDDLWVSQKLEWQMELFAVDPGIGLVYGGVEFFRAEDGVTTANYYPGSPLDFHELLGHTIVALQTVVIRSSVLASVGGFDPSLRGTDDWDFCMRVASTSKMRGVDRPCVRVRLHPDNQSRKTNMMYRNAVAALRKNAKVHGGRCKACRDAVKRSMRILRNDLYRDRADTAKLAQLEGRYLRAARLAVAAVFVRPTIVFRLLSRMTVGLVRR